MDIQPENLRFYNPTRGEISLEEVISEIINFIAEDPKNIYQIKVGTDSGSAGSLVFATAITIHRVGKGGRFFITKISDKLEKYPTFRQRIYEETMLSLSIAMILWPQLEARLKEVYPIDHEDLKIHLDIGNDGPTREMIKEIVGMIKGNGFEAEIKPASYAASTVADRFT